MSTPETPAQTLQEQFAAVAVSFTWLSWSKTMTSDQREQAAETFNANGRMLRLSKKLIDDKNKTWRNLTQLKTRVRDYWVGMSLPFPQDGVRLIKRDRVQDFDETMGFFHTEMREAVTKLQDEYDTLKNRARRLLGDAFNENDYPSSLTDKFGFDHAYVNVTPPDYLKTINPELYEQEKARIAARFDEAAKMAEEAFTVEFAKVLAHLTERMTGNDADGKPKVFRDSCIVNLQEFVTKFRELSVNGSVELERLIADMHGLVSNVKPQDVRDQDSLRERIRAAAADTLTKLEPMMQDEPRRRILRQTPNATPPGTTPVTPSGDESTASSDSPAKDA